MLNFIVCDDNINILERLSKMLETIFINHSLDANIVLQAAEGKPVIEFIANNAVDVLLLDKKIRRSFDRLFS